VWYLLRTEFDFVQQFALTGVIQSHQRFPNSEPPPRPPAVGPRGAGV
jgi:hypothetical protein